MAALACLISLSLFGSAVEDTDARIASALEAAIEACDPVGWHMDSSARELWNDVRHDFDHEGLGLFAGTGELAHVEILRVAALASMLDCWAETINCSHIRTGVFTWRLARHAMAACPKLQHLNLEAQLLSHGESTPKGGES